MKFTTKIILSVFIYIILILGYIIVIQNIAITNNKIIQESIPTNGFNEKLSFSESVSVDVTSNKWYGTIHKTRLGNNNLDYLQISSIKIPLQVNELNVRAFHFIFVLLLFLSSVFLIILFTIIEYKRRKNALGNQTSIISS